MKILKALKDKWNGVDNYHPNIGKVQYTWEDVENTRKDVENKMEEYQNTVREDQVNLKYKWEDVKSGKITEEEYHRFLKEYNEETHKLFKERKITYQEYSARNDIWLEELEKSDDDEWIEIKFQNKKEEAKKNVKDLKYKWEDVKNGKITEPEFRKYLDEYSDETDKLEKEGKITLEEKLVRGDILYEEHCKWFEERDKLIEERVKQIDLKYKWEDVRSGKITKVEYDRYLDEYSEKTDKLRKEGKITSEEFAERIRIWNEEYNKRLKEHKTRLVEEDKKEVAKPLQKVHENPQKELQNLIGLNSVKTEIETLTNFIKIQQLRKDKGLKSSQLNYHCVFTGNPGTGKTTVGRIIGAIYKELGILKSGHLVETDRSGLVGEYIGHTAVKTNKIIDSALDGVLFIDEAYSLIAGGRNDFGKEAIATLLKRMEDDRDRLVVVLAGYTDEMKDFINTNPGLESRFNRYIEFPDYSDSELYQIFELNLKNFDYHLADNVDDIVKTIFTKAVENKDRNFGNARFVRNFFEKTLERQSNRLAKEVKLTAECLSEITESDIID
ncbi:MAG: AAA family ATPase [Marinilabiliaceae bacterium]|nr:AAA family ATPase [Marinilabiliaceae bacterium]